jgi:hypothetical protein
MALASNKMCVTSESRESAAVKMYRNDLHGEFAMLDGGKFRTI